MVTTNGLEFESIGDDPIIFSPPVVYPEGGSLRVTIRMRTTVSPWGELFFGRAGWPYTGDFIRGFDVNPDGNWHEYVMVIPSRGGFETVLRVDAVTWKGQVEIAWISVEPFFSL